MQLDNSGLSSSPSFHVWLHDSALLTIPTISDDFHIEIWTKESWTKCWQWDEGKIKCQNSTQLYTPDKRDPNYELPTCREIAGYNKYNGIPWIPI